MSNYQTCFGCGDPIRRGFPMITEKGTEVIICEKCMRLWKKYKGKEAEATKGADDE